MKIIRGGKHPYIPHRKFITHSCCLIVLFEQRRVPNFCHKQWICCECCLLGILLHGLLLTIVILLWLLPSNKITTKTVTDQMISISDSFVSTTSTSESTTTTTATTTTTTVTTTTTTSGKCHLIITVYPGFVYHQLRRGGYIRIESQ